MASLIGFIRLSPSEFLAFAETIYSLNAVFKLIYGPVRTEAFCKENLVQSLPRKMKVSGHFKICVLDNVLDRILCVTLKKGSYLKHLHPPTCIPSGPGCHCLIWAENRCNGEEGV